MLLSDVLASERTGRLDSSYFTKEQLTLRSLAATWPMLGKFCSRIVCGPFGSNVLDTNYVENGIPMLRPFNLRGLRSDASEMVFLSPEFISCQNLKLFKRGDIAFARVGDVGCGIVVQPEVRDSRVIISSSTNGYKVPLNKKDIYDYVAHANVRIGPQLYRVKLCRESVKLATLGNYDVLDFQEFQYLKAFYDKHLPSEKNGSDFKI